MQPNITHVATHADLDGLVSAMLLCRQHDIDSSNVIFRSPGNAQNGGEKLQNNYAVTDLPYIENAGLWFDHHPKNFPRAPNIPGKREEAPSCARVILNQYNISEYSKLITATDKIDTLNLTADELSNPQGYVLLSRIIASNIKDPEAMDFNRHLIELLATHDIDQILTDPKVAERVRTYQENLPGVIDYIRKHSCIDGNVVVVDLRKAPSIYSADGYKDLEYGLFPHTNVSVRVTYSEEDRTRFRIGHSLVNRTCQTDIAELLEPLGGGGHKRAGGVSVDSDQADNTYSIIMRALVETQE